MMTTMELVDPIGAPSRLQQGRQAEPGDDPVGAQDGGGLRTLVPCDWHLPPHTVVLQPHGKTRT